MGPRPFHAIFAGLDDYHGTYELPLNAPAAGEKFKGRAVVVKAPVTVDLYNRHMRGEAKGLGIIPIMRDDSCWFFVIDVDDYNDKGPKYWSEKIDKLGLPLVVCASKSNGSHLYGFVTRPCPAGVLRNHMKKILRKLNLPQPPKTELFPRQDNLTEDGVGNWINLPYFGDTRKAVLGDRHLKINEFLELVHAREMDPDELGAVVTKASLEKGEDAIVPPCIMTMQRDGVPEGGRNVTLTHVATYLQRRHGDDFADKLEEWNQEYCDPPVRFQEVMEVVRSVSKKHYNYKCKEPHIKAICNASKCGRVEFGIGNEGDEAYTDVPFTHLTRVLTEPISWVAEVNGTKVSCSTQQLMSFTQFQIRAAEEMKVMMKDRTNKEWKDLVAELMCSAEDEIVPLTVTETGMVQNIFWDWCSAECPTCKKMDHVLAGRPFYDEKTDSIYFNSIALLRVVHGHQRISSAVVWRAIEMIGGIQEKVEVDNKDMMLWVVSCGGSVWFDPPKIGEERF